MSSFHSFLLPINLVPSGGPYGNSSLLAAATLVAAVLLGATRWLIYAARLKRPFNAWALKGVRIGSRVLLSAGFAPVVGQMMNIFDCPGGAWKDTSMQVR